MMSLFQVFLQKNGKVIFIVGLVVIVLYFVSQQILPSRQMRISNPSSGLGKSMMGYQGAVQDSYSSEMSTSFIAPPIAPDIAPSSNVSNRLVIQNSSLSLLVSNVTEVKNKILDYVTQSGGYMVSSDVQGQEEAPTAAVTVRVPSQNLEQTLTFFRSLSIRVVSENLQGHDVTDQFVDIEKRIALLEKTKAQFDAILAQSKEVSDITNVTREILNIQAQIDQYVGQQESLSKNAELSKVTIYLSTDEIALPYEPSNVFRPTVIFKQAVRSLISLAHQIAALLIWLAVYSIVWIPILVISLLVYRRLHKGK